ncbi:GNAT family N-acetyltransferase [Jiangella alkaliphila]|uniref:Ribosomal protein S18 acetylase RimI n=1 Tax=Jiangella alkaliphila TaxID=419479 RepID=A0A1H2KQL3_9ACTN|nr:GNAT family N-acetyltransferase [Jiangella alkaliphila]SDU70940.1 Ribosomal protein S18 acetylase RimI [Jiangella alkaliphila]
MTIRPRTPADVPALAAILARDHEATGYPYVLPDDPAAWIATPSDLVAFVAADAADEAYDGRPSGHVSVGAAATTDHGAGTVLQDAWSTAHGRPVEDCAVVGRLFVAADRQRRGLGERLLDTAVGWMRDRDLAPCLDVLPIGPAASVVSWYEARGWVVAGEASPVWRRPGWPPLLALVLEAE